MAYPNVILLKGDIGTRQEEGRAGGTIKPGYLIKKNSSGALVVHASAGGAGECIVALEDPIQGGRTIDDNYVSGELVKYKTVQPGDELYMMLKDGNNVAIDDNLSSQGDGTLRKESSTGTVFFKALEALDLTSAGANARLKVRAIF